MIGMNSLFDKGVKMFIWNPEAKLAIDIEDKSVVRPTSYDEISYLLGTSGCSNDGKGWSWEVMGVIDTPHGKLVVCPGNFVHCLPDAGSYTINNFNSLESNITVGVKTGTCFTTPPGYVEPGHPESIYAKYPINRDYKKKNGLSYRLLMIVNKRPTKPGYAPTVVYRGADGNEYAMLFSQWVSKFTLID